MKQIIQDHIRKLQAETATLQAIHDSLVIEYQQMNMGYQNRIQQNQNRFQQISGAIKELEKLLNEYNDTGSGSDREPEEFANRIPGFIGGVGHHLRPDLGNRELVQPYPAPGETGDSHSPGGPGDPLGGH